MSDSDEEPQQYDSDGSAHDHTSEEQEEYTRLPPIPRKRDVFAKKRMIELLHKLEDLIEHNVT